MAGTVKKIDCKLEGKTLYATTTGLRLGSKGRTLRIDTALGIMSKGEARRCRKALRKIGRTDLSGAPRYNGEYIRESLDDYR